MQRNFSAVALFLFLNWIDVVLTCYVILHGGIEVMPMAGFVIAEFGLIGFVIFKALASLSAVLVLNDIGQLRLIKYINALMFIVCFVNMISVTTIFYSS